MDEEERRRRCIIDPASCGAPPPGARTAFTPQQQALGEELWVAYKSPHDQPWGHLSPDHQEPWLRQAAALLAVFEFDLVGAREGHQKALEEAKAALGGNEKGDEKK